MPPVSLALRSTLNAILLEPAARSRVGLFALVGVALPLCVGFQSPTPQSLAAAPSPRTELPNPAKGWVAENHLATPQIRGSIIPVMANAAMARPFFFTGPTSAREQATNCLAAAAWYEAGDDPVGQRAVIQVVLNRLHHPSFPKTICGVVLQGSERKTGCQFTFTCDGSLDRRRPGTKSWNRALALAENALDGSVDAEVSGATHYHADYVNPSWNESLITLARIGRHIFYGWPGKQGNLTERPQGAASVSLAEYSRLLPSWRGAPISGSTDIADQVPPKIPIDSMISVGDPVRGVADSATSLFARSDSFVISVDAAQPSGRWAIDALRHCSNQRNCKVLGYTAASTAARNSIQPTNMHDLPQFILLRDSISGQVKAWWDCNIAQRPENSQCLPKGRAEIQSLMH